MDDASETQRGAIARILVDEQLVTEEQLGYAERIRAKLEDGRPLLAVLEELGYVEMERVQAVLREHRTQLRLGELLVELGRIREDELRMALDIQAEEPDRKQRLGEILIEHHFVSDVDLARVLSQHLGVPHCEPAPGEIDRNLLSRAPADWLRKHLFVPIRCVEQGTLVAFADPTDPSSLEAAETAFGKGAVVPAIASRAWLRQTLEAGAAPAEVSRSGPGQESAAVGVVDAMIEAAIARDASDIHVEPMADRIRIRFREDGVLIPHRDYPLALGPSLASRIKVLCKADIAERRRHQGGRFVHRCNDLELDLRVSIYVTVHGEKIVLRLLNRQRQLLSIDEIGMAPRMVERFLDDALERPSGVILVTGPTGSGKTSTLYSCVRHINRPETSIITAEDPVEYVIDGISQCSLNAAIDLTYEETLRHIVRQDPDVIVIGEIRDTFSAETAIQAALTGHKVLTTFHTEDSIGGLLRLLNMEIEAFLVSSTVVSVLAQRLLRRVCVDCATDHVPTASELRRLGYARKEMADAGFKAGRGCETCRFTGYRGRTAVFELLVLDEPVRDAVLNRRTAHEIRRISRESSGLMTLFEDGIVKAASGLTTVQEVLRMLPRLDTPRPLRDLRRVLGE